MPLGLANIDGIAIRQCEQSGYRPEPVVAHPNGISRLDHVVVATPDVDRTIQSFAAVGWELRRQRPTAIDGAPATQSFFWAGDVILEVVGPDAVSGDGPATIWGLAFVSADIDATCTWLGPLRCRPPSEAVQGRRRIATLLTGDLGILTRVAVMSPHHPTPRTLGVNQTSISPLSSS